MASPTGFEARDGDDDAGLSEIPADDADDIEDSPASKPANPHEVAQRGPGSDDEEERGLRLGLARAAAEGQWAAVEVLNKRLEELLRRRAEVIDLGVERKRRRR